MRTLLVIVVLIALMVVGGWLVFTNKNGSTSVEFRSDEAQRDVDKVLDDAEHMIDGVRGRRVETTTTLENPPPNLNAPR